MTYSNSLGTLYITEQYH